MPLSTAVALQPASADPRHADLEQPQGPNEEGLAPPAAPQPPAGAGNAPVAPPEPQFATTAEALLCQLLIDKKRRRGRKLAGLVLLVEALSDTIPQCSRSTLKCCVRCTLEAKECLFASSDEVCGFCRQTAATEIYLSTVRRPYRSATAAAALTRTPAMLHVCIVGQQVQGIREKKKQGAKRVTTSPVLACCHCLYLAALVYLVNAAVDEA